MNEIQTFESDQFGTVRAVRGEDGEPMFVAKDVCAALNIAPTAASRLDEDENGLRLTQAPGGEQNVLLVSEPGFYKLVMRSRKPEAKAFQRWVTHEVLPALRRDGAYVASDGTEDEDTLIARALVAVKRKLDERDRQLGAAEAENRRLTAKGVGMCASRYCRKGERVS